MDEFLRKHVKIAAAFILLLAMGLTTYGNYLFSLYNPGGNDFLPYWLGTQLLIKEGQSPYSTSTAIRIQTFAYGRPALPEEGEMGVFYPLYSLLIFLPFSLISNYSLARTLWMTFLEAASILIVILSLRLFRWQPGSWFSMILFLFSLFWYHGLRAIVNGNAVVLVGLFLLGSIFALSHQREVLAGVLLSLATIKPQVALVPYLFLSLWGIVHQRKRFVIAAWGSLILLISAGMFIIPDWLFQNFSEVLKYPTYTAPGNPSAALARLLPGVGNYLGALVSAIAWVAMGLLWKRHLKYASSESFPQLPWLFYLTFTLAQWSGIQTDPGNFVALLPGLILVYALWERTSARPEATRIIILLNLAFVMVSLWGLFLITLEHTSQPVQSPVMFFPLPSMLLFWLLRAGKQFKPLADIANSR